jgi:hypothetical protein
MGNGLVFQLAKLGWAMCVCVCVFFFPNMFSAGLGRVWGKWIFLGLRIQNKRELG